MFEKNQKKLKKVIDKIKYAQYNTNCSARNKKSTLKSKQLNPLEIKPKRLLHFNLNVVPKNKLFLKSL